MIIAARLRQPAGTVLWLEFDKARQREARMHNVASVAQRLGALIQQKSYNAFDRQNAPRYLLRVEILKPGREAEKRGRK